MAETDGWPMLSFLVVDDEAELLGALTAVLEARGHQVSTAMLGADALEAITANDFDVVILDLSLPDMSGLDVLRAIRKRSRVPVLILSVIGREQTKIEALDLGADDYLTKPFSTGELLARLRAVVRRKNEGSTPSRRTVAGDIVIDDDAHQVTVAGSPVGLTRREYEILRFLAQNAGRVLTYDNMTEGVWGRVGAVEHQVVRVHLSNLRRKIEDVPAAPRRIVTEPGVGIRLVSKP